MAAISFKPSKVFPDDYGRTQCYNELRLCMYCTINWKKYCKGYVKFVYDMDQSQRFKMVADIRNTSWFFRVSVLLKQGWDWYLCLLMQAIVRPSHFSYQSSASFKNNDPMELMLT